MGVATWATTAEGGIERSPGTILRTLPCLDAPNQGRRAASEGDFRDPQTAGRQPQIQPTLGKHIASTMRPLAHTRQLWITGSSNPRLSTKSSFGP
jgi:hypothetical protein